MAPLRVLTLSTLYPNAEMPNFSIFVENRLRHLLLSGEVAARVVAPVPWFPFTDPRFGAYAQQARIPRAETRHGIEILHPRYAMLPGVGMYLQPWAIYRAVLPVLRRMIAEGFDFEVIDAHYFYPTGVAATWLGQALDRPVVVTSRGTDLTVLPDFRLPRYLMRRAIARADGLITVSGALRDKLLTLGAAPDKVRVLRNGVDLKHFRLLDRAEARAKLGLSGHILLSVGNLVPGKAHDLTIRAMAELPEMTLLIAGRGPEEERLQALIASLGLQDRVRLLGLVPHDRLPDYYNAADILVHASEREGMANVLLESLACGTPIVAAAIPGMDEVVDPPESGLLMARRTPDALAAAVRQLMVRMPPREKVRLYAEKFDWDATTRGQLDLFREVIARHQAAAEARDRSGG